jgi:glutathione S-transferase
VLTLRKIIKAERVFEAWTTPALLRKWWGPENVTCSHAEVDLRAGGAYRLANLHADGRITWITGVFELVRPPEELVYSWNIGMAGADGSRVRVEFLDHPQGTELVLRHERLADDVRGMHLQGWEGCLKKLLDLFAR